MSRANPGGEDSLSRLLLHASQGNAGQILFAQSYYKAQILG
jgi:hypothetical protein